MLYVGIVLYLLALLEISMERVQRCEVVQQWARLIP